MRVLFQDFKLFELAVQVFNTVFAVLVQDSVKKLIKEEVHKVLSALVDGKTFVGCCHMLIPTELAINYELAIGGDQILLANCFKAWQEDWIRKR